jgi:hypothetical protein
LRRRARAPQVPRAGIAGVDVRTLALLLLLAIPSGDTPARERALARETAAEPHELLDPARCVRRYLAAVRRAAPYPEQGRARGRPARESAYEAAKRLTAPRTLEEIDARRARGERHHPMAPWEAAGTDAFVQSFELLAVRRAPAGAAVVTVKERLYRLGRGDRLDRVVTEYLVAQVGGAWRVVDRRPRGTFTDGDVERYVGWWDGTAAAATSTAIPD